MTEMERIRKEIDEILDGATLEQLRIFKSELIKLIASWEGSE